jgi:hypothetical protein
LICELLILRPLGHNIVVDAAYGVTGLRRTRAYKKELNVKNDIVFKKPTLYEREVMKKQKFFIRWQMLLYSYNRWLGNHSLKAT